MRIPFRSTEEIRQATPAVTVHLADGGLIAYPTETVYGLGCALRAHALAALAGMKRRAAGKPFLLLIEAGDAITGVHWTPAARVLAERFWPGPLTLALRAEPGAFPPEVLSATGAVAIRASSHAAPHALVRALGEPITSTSANAPGEPAALEPGAVERAFASLGPEHANVWLLDGGQLPPSPPSTVVDCTADTPRIVREGAIPRDELGRVIEEIDDG